MQSNIINNYLYLSQGDICSVYFEFTLFGSKDESSQRDRIIQISNHQMIILTCL
jgi:hypothetical protein